MYLGLIKRSMVGLACLGMIAPQSRLEAAPVEAPVTQKAEVADVVLVGGNLSGRVVNDQGQLLAGAAVKASFHGQVVAESVSNANGEFVLSNMQTGLYELSTETGSVAVRAWDQQVAPPAGKSQVLLVNGNAERAQILRRTCNSCPGGGAGLAAIVALSAVTAIVINEANDDDDVVSP